MIGAALAFATANTREAWSNCTVAVGVNNSVFCSGAFATTDTSNTNGATANSQDRYQQFTNGLAVGGSVASGAALTGVGLSIFVPGASAISFTNSGSIDQQTASTVGGVAALQLEGNDAITYSGAGTVTSSVGALGVWIQQNNTAATGAISATFNGNIVGGTYGVNVQPLQDGTATIGGSGNISGNKAIYVLHDSSLSSSVGNLTIGGTGNTIITGTNGVGITVGHGASAGAILINRSGTIDNGVGGAGNGEGIIVNDDGTGDVQITGVGAINVTKSGINVSQNGGGNVAISTTNSVAAGNGSAAIFGSATGAGTVTIYSAGAVTVDGNGIVAQTINGLASINMTAGNVLATGYGLYAVTTGAGGVTIDMSGGQLGTGVNRIGSRAINVQTQDASAGAINITANKIFSVDGILATHASSNAAINLTANGAIDTSGATAIQTQAQGGATTINVNAPITSSSVLTGVISAASTGGAFTINNNLGGNITSSRPFPETQVAVAANNALNGNIAFTNAGTLWGVLALGLGNNTVNNSGVWNTGSINTLGAATVTNAGTINVIENARMQGTGVTLTNSGTLSLTTPTSVFAMQGNLTLQNGGTYRINLNSTTSSVTNVTGAASLGGAVNAVFAAGSYAVKQYTILTTTGGRTGTFSGVTQTSAPAGFSSSLSYDSTNVYLDLALSPVNTGAGLPTNGAAAAGSIANFFNNGGTLPPGFVTLASSSNPSNAYGQIAGQPGAAQTQAGQAGTTQFINTIFGAIFGGGGFGGASNFAQDNALEYAGGKKRSREAQEAYAAVTPRDGMSPIGERWGLWASAYGGNQTVLGSASAGTNTTTSRIFGLAVGADYRYSDSARVGIAMGGAGTSFSLDSGFGGGSADMFNAAIYAKHNYGAAYVAGLLGYAWQDVKTDRTVTVAGVDRLRASFSTNALASRIETGYRHALPAFAFVPYAALQSTTFFVPAYGEVATSGSNQFALNFSRRDITAIRSELGARFDKAIVIRDGVFTWHGRLAWAHDWNNDRGTTANFQTLVGSSGFTVNGAQPSANSAILSFGGTMAWHSGWSIAANLDGEFSSTTRGYVGKAILRRVW